MKIKKVNELNEKISAMDQEFALEDLQDELVNHIDKTEAYSICKSIKELEDMIYDSAMDDDDIEEEKKVDLIYNIISRYFNQNK